MVCCRPTGTTVHHLWAGGPRGFRIDVCTKILPSKHDKLIQCLYNVGPTSQTEVQYLTNIRSKTRSCVCWEVIRSAHIRNLSHKSDKCVLFFRKYIFNVVKHKCSEIILSIRLVITFNQYIHVGIYQLYRITRLPRYIFLFCSDRNVQGLYIKQISHFASLIYNIYFWTLLTERTLTMRKRVGLQLVLSESWWSNRPLGYESVSATLQSEWFTLSYQRGRNMQVWISNVALWLYTCIITALLCDTTKEREL